MKITALKTNKLVATSAALGLALTGITFASPSVSAATITRVPGNFAFSDPNVPEGWQNLNWVARGRASAPGDWEFGVTSDEDISGVVDQSHGNWDSGEEVAWSLFWDEEENKVTFNIGGSNLVFDQPGDPIGKFNGFFLWTKSHTTNGRVDPGTEMLVQLNEVNGDAIAPVTSSATAPENGLEISKFFFASDMAIESMSGFVKMSWPDGGNNPQQKRARDRVAFKIEGFYTGEPHTEVPEPASALGILALGALGFGLKQKKKGN